MPTRRDVLSLVALAALAPAAARGGTAPSSALDAVGPLGSGAFHPGRALEAIRALTALGKADGLPLLRRIADGHRELESGLFAVIRALVVLPEGATLQPPMLGAPVPEPSDALHAPRYPLVLIADVPLVVVSGYMLGGQPEPLSMHLDALEALPWRTAPWQPAPADTVRAQLQAAPWWEACGVQDDLLGQLRRYARPK